MMQQNPQMMQQVLAQVAQTNPELLPMLQQNPEALMQILAQMGQGGGADMGGEGDDPMGGAAAGAPAATVNLTPEEDEAVKRLEQLGFSRMECVQAYMAADKNEVLAANLLFDM